MGGAPPSDRHAAGTRTRCTRTGDGVPAALEELHDAFAGPARAQPPAVVRISRLPTCVPLSEEAAAVPPMAETVDEPLHKPQVGCVTDEFKLIAAGEITLPFSVSKHP